MQFNDVVTIQKLATISYYYMIYVIYVIYYHSTISKRSSPCLRSPNSSE